MRQLAAAVTAIVSGVKKLRTREKKPHLKQKENPNFNDLFTDELESSPSPEAGKRVVELINPSNSCYQTPVRSIATFILNLFTFAKFKTSRTTQSQTFSRSLFTLLPITITSKHRQHTHGTSSNVDVRWWRDTTLQVQLTSLKIRLSKENFFKFLDKLTVEIHLGCFFFPLVHCLGLIGKLLSF